VPSNTYVLLVQLTVYIIYSISSSYINYRILYDYCIRYYYPTLNTAAVVAAVRSSSSSAVAAVAQ
jgi:hypothetical protein